MAKEFYTTGTGANQTLTESPNEKIPVYDSKTDMDTDISNIAEGEIVATKAGESEGVVEVVDEVTDGVMNPVTSNAVYDVLKPVDVSSHFTFPATTWDTQKSFHAVKTGNVVEINAQLKSTTQRTWYTRAFYTDLLPANTTPPNSVLYNQEAGVSGQDVNLFGILETSGDYAGQFGMATRTNIIADREYRLHMVYVCE